MTHRTIWTEPGAVFPDHVDHATAEDAHAHALATSARIGGEVAVVEVGGEQ